MPPREPPSPAPAGAPVPTAPAVPAGARPAVGDGARREADGGSDGARHAADGGSEAQAVAVFVALADPTRRHVLDSLAREGPATLAELSARLPITRQAVAKHIALLVEAGLVVAGEPEGRRVPYRLRPEPVRAALAWLAALANRWDDRLGGLRAHLDADRPG